jgi:PKD repeat protein
MSARTAFLAGVAGASLVLTGLVASGQAPQAVPAPASALVLDNPGTVHFTASGDISSGSDAVATLSQIGSIDPDLHFALGDLSYGTTGAEEAWCDFVTSRVGAGFPFELISGNHESNGMNGNINDFSACLPNQLPGLVGTYGRQYYVDVPEVNPLVRFVMISPALTFPDGLWSYAAGTPRYQWTASAIDGARADGIPWVVVGLHRPCLTIGQYGCDSGADLMNLLVSKRVDLVLGGHEHLYARSKQLAHGASCASIVPDAYDPGCVRDSDNSFTKGAGTVFAIAGTGGTPLRDVNIGDVEGPYFAASSGLNLNPSFGNLDVSATADTLTAAFRSTAGGTFTDAFTIGGGGTPANEPPTASFTSPCTALACSFDASASRDADGTIGSYAWAFGDGASATGLTAPHTYTAAGTYTVGLTVTDNAGATGTTTRSVMVAPAGQPATLASDAFARTVTNGFGTADVGGAWTVTGPTSAYSVDGAGKVLFPSPGLTKNLYLAGVSSSATDLRFTVSANKAATGTGTFLSVSGRRIVGVGAYQAKVVFRSSGAVGLSLVRVNSTGGSEVVVQPAINVPGLSVAAGDAVAVRLQVTGTNPTTLRARVWKGGTAEPTTWQRSVTDSTSTLQAPGALGLTLYLSGTSTSTPLVVSFDDLTAVTP